MKETKELTIQEYHPLKSTFSVEQNIQNRVNLEAIAEWARTPNIPIPVQKIDKEKKKLFRLKDLIP